MEDNIIIDGLNRENERLMQENAALKENASQLQFQVDRLKSEVADAKYSWKFQLNAERDSKAELESRHSAQLESLRKVVQELEAKNVEMSQSLMRENAFVLADGYIKENQRLQHQNKLQKSTIEQLEEHWREKELQHEVEMKAFKQQVQELLDDQKAANSLTVENEKLKLQLQHCLEEKEAAEAREGKLRKELEDKVKALMSADRRQKVARYALEPKRGKDKLDNLTPAHDSNTNLDSRPRTRSAARLFATTSPASQSLTSKLQDSSAEACDGSISNSFQADNPSEEDNKRIKPSKSGKNKNANGALSDLPNGHIKPAAKDSSKRKIRGASKMEKRKARRFEGETCL